ncbi:hypothetical protein [Brevundimonas sp.]|jgi:hypothetical protein|uniref:hypothetical protein n=1 Tax=Brevundimonas sp. TaxID=1871086 RepID=UPI0037851B9D
MKILIALGAALSLAACASPYVATPYDRTASQVRSIAVVDDSAPENSIAYEVASVGRNFGLIGAIVDAGIQAERQAAVNRALDGTAFDGETVFERQLAAALAREGYEVNVMTDTPRAKQAFLVAYPTADGVVDAYLDVVIAHHGYLSAGAFRPFRPSAAAQVRLVSAADPTRVLMDNRIVYNGMTTADAGVITLTPNPDYEFENREALLADPVKMAAGIEDALNQIADTTAQLLR